jgi:hypothetical protein
MTMPVELGNDTLESIRAGNNSAAFISAELRTRFFYD